MRSVAAWCALGINSLSRVCLSLIITCRPHWPVCLQSAATRGARHVDLCIVCRWWNATSLTLSEFGSTLFTRHSHTNLQLANAVCINRLPCCITCTTRKLERSGDRITCSKERGGGRESVPYSGRVNHGNHIDPPITLQGMWSPATLWGVTIDLQSFFQIQFLKKHSIPVFATSREVKQKFLVIWEGLEPWCFLFHILFLSPPLSGYSINNAKDLVARGAMGDGFTKSPLPAAITSEGKSSQGTGCSLIGSPVAGQRSGVNNWLYRFPCDGPQENR